MDRILIPAYCFAGIALPFHDRSIYQWKIVEEKKVEKPPRYQPVARC